MVLFVHKFAMESIMKEHHVDVKDSTNHGHDEAPSTNVTPVIEKTSDDEETRRMENSTNYLKCLRKRNAIYSKRKYYKNKMYFEEMQRRKDELKSMNDKLKSENEQLEALVQQAKDKVMMQARREEIVQKLMSQQLQRQQQQAEEIRVCSIAPRKMTNGFVANARSIMTPMGHPPPMRHEATSPESRHFPLSPVTVLPSQQDLIHDFASRRTSALVEQALHQQRQHQRDISLLLLQQQQAPRSFSGINHMLSRSSNDHPLPSFRHNSPWPSDDGTGGRLMRAIEAAQSLSQNGVTRQEPYYTPLRNESVAAQFQQQRSHSQPMGYVMAPSTLSTVQKTPPSKNPQPFTEGIGIDLNGILEQYQTKKRLAAATQALHLVSDVATTAAHLIRPRHPEGPGHHQSNPLHSERLLSKIVNAGPASRQDALLYAHLSLQQVNKH